MLYKFYNHYLNTINPKSMSPYDAHKKNDLKKLCSTIINLNKKSPLYLIDMTDELQINIINLKEHARDLKNMILSISEEEDSNTFRMFHDKILTSSDEEVVSARYIGDEASFADAPPLEVEVHELSSHQVNKGNYVYSETSSLSIGTYSFYVTISNTNYEFQFQVNDSDKNRELIKKITNMINRANIGIYATMESNETEDRSRIVFTSLSTGTPAFSDIIFKVTDGLTPNGTSAVKYFGLDHIEQKPTNASFTINNVSRTSSSNTFTVNKQYELTLLKTTNPKESISISFQNDKESIFNRISSFVDAYNNLISVAQEIHSSFEINAKLVSDVGYIATCYKNELDAMGLFVQEDSSIHIDRDLLKQAINEEENKSGTYTAFRSFRNSLNTKVDNLLLNPMEYLARTIVNYPNINESFSPTKTISLYSGLIYNNYC